MTTKKFDGMPTPSEPIDLEDISQESVKAAWQDYQSKPEYKDFNKHDMIEAMQHAEDDKNKK